jgi:hypothetical protein
MILTPPGHVVSRPGGHEWNERLAPKEEYTTLRNSGLIRTELSALLRLDHPRWQVSQNFTTAGHEDALRVVQIRCLRWVGAGRSTRPDSELKG